MDFSPNSGLTLAENLTSLLDNALVESRKAEYEKGRGSGDGAVAAKRIGAGYIGTECARALAFKYHKFAKDVRESTVSPGELQRHAESGHWTEEKTAEWMLLAGFDIRVKKPDGKQYGFMAAKDPITGQFRMAGEVDGVILGVPPRIAGKIVIPAIWESKKATDKKWKDFSKNGVAAADPKYYGQLQTNMAYMEIGNTLFSMLNLDNMKYYWEIVPYDAANAQRLTDRAVKVLESKVPEDLPRIAYDSTNFKCKFCDYAETCWKR